MLVVKLPALLVAAFASDVAWAFHHPVFLVGHANVPDVMVALAPALNTLLILVAFVRQASVRHEARTARHLAAAAKTQVEEVAHPIEGGRRSYDPQGGDPR